MKGTSSVRSRLASPCAFVAPARLETRTLLAATDLLVWLSPRLFVRLRRTGALRDASLCRLIKKFLMVVKGSVNEFMIVILIMMKPRIAVEGLK